MKCIKNGEWGPKKRVKPRNICVTVPSFLSLASFTVIPVYN